MRITETTEQKAWNELLLSQPTQTTAIAGQAGIFLQSWEWGEFQKAMGRRVYRYQAHDGFAQVIELPLAFRKKYWFIPRGTLIDGLEEEAKKRGVLFVRFEPSLERLQEVTRSYKKLQEVTPVHPKQTLLIELTKSEEKLLEGMHEKTRYNVRLALRKGVRYQSRSPYDRGSSAWPGVSGISEFDTFWKLIQETAKRDRFWTHPKEYYETMLRTLQKGDCFVRFRATYHGSVMLAGAIVGYFGDTATYLHGASSYEHRALMGPYALHWHIMQDAKKSGYRVYDFWGITARQHAEGIARFKLGFGGTPIDYSGTFDLPLSRFWYTVYRLGRTLL